MPDENVTPPAPASADDALGAPAPVVAERPSRRAITLSVSMLATAVLLAAVAVLPAPYSVSSPGPTEDVLGKVDDKPLITIDGAPTYDSTGELRLTTVSATGGPGYPSSTLRVLRGWFSPWSVVQPREILFPDADESQEDIDRENTAQMVSSQENAAVAALSELGRPVPATLVVADTVEDTGADGVFEDGDIITAIDGTPLPDYQSLVTTMAAVKPGADVTVTVRRQGEEVDLTVETTAGDDGRAQMGVYIDPDFDMPVDVTIDAGRIGGPSAGTMFALGIIDLLTPQDEANGQVVAGTGTIDVVGRVGAIGGIRQKLAGAHRDGARWFLAPEANCGEVVGHVPDGLRVVRVATLHEAYTDLVAIGKGEGDALPTCTKEPAGS
ncbi:PDZ domain-containing protein [Cellulomonas sp. PSBB021]|uniref:YlbL family protein n=1 Tax=Cellulomonas sp. PSBB021 TaxID=2003551 RepID=UPI000A602770|nr:S16 family serine protease [Cellulomonas sp. PSBB021]